MAFTSRLLCRSKKLYDGQAIVRRENAVPIRFYAKEAAPPAMLKGDEMLWNIFFDVKKKFEIALGILRKEKITIDPDDPVAVTQYAKVMKTIREKADLLSVPQRVKNIIQEQTKGIPDARTYLVTLQDIRVKNGLSDDIGAEIMMFDALEKVEKEIKKPLLRDDKKGMALLIAEFDKINKKLGIHKEDLPKYEEELEIKLAKDQLTEIKEEVVEEMANQIKRKEFQDEKMVDVRSLDVRNFI
ncbi:hypothetical protein QJS10_CPA01g01392 [Acorus calamus]|uniref:ATP synthase 24 kDa subunit, mitochondrial n=1 Tax=Acorus calamus TaxID=4465 RepID=A0AAV9FR40_ACOCL|nr:hypothetical protein QJS10_CPA01g01392 [Acorus calamus]